MKRILLLLQVIATAWSPLASQSPRLGENVRIGTFRPLAQPGFHYWDKGNLIAWDTDGTLAPPVLVYGSDGEVKLAASLRYPGINAIRVHSAAIDRGGQLYVSAGVVSPAGAVASVLAKADPAGDIANLIRLGSFTPYHICAGDDGSVWAYGPDHDAETVRQDGSEYDTLRHYSFSQGLLRSYLPRSTMKAPGVTLLGRRPQDVELRCTVNGVVLFYTPTSELIEVDASGKVSREHIPPLGRRVRVLGFAAADTGEVYVSLDDTAERNCGVFRLSPLGSTPRKWIGVDGTIGACNQFQAYLLGMDGTNLLLHRRFPGPQLDWVPIRR